MIQHHTAQKAIRKNLITQNVPLHDKNWFGSGGIARYYAEPTTAAEFQYALQFAHESTLPFFVLGSGANCLISDDGFNGLVIRPQLNAITHTSMDDGTALVTAGAGVTMSDLITHCLAHHIIGLEEFSGIPGTVGGSVYINLHYFNFLLAQFLSHARVIEHNTNKLMSVDNTWFEFGYDYSKLHAKNHVLLEATFKLTHVSEAQAAYARGRSDEIIRHRAARYPQQHTCGSFFRNFHEHEVTITSNGKRMVYAAYYLDKIGIKGALRIGNAQVSYQHANMIVNLGNATSTDIINLARCMQERVYEEFGLILQPECQLIGFSSYPLYKNSIK